MAEIELDAVMARAWDFVRPKLPDLNREKGPAGVWSNGFRSGWDAARALNTAPGSGGEAVPVGYMAQIGLALLREGTSAAIWPVRDHYSSEPVYARPSPATGLVEALPVVGSGKITQPTTGLRVCVERDAICPHGVKCPYMLGDGYRCDMEASRAALSALKQGTA